MSIVQVGNLPSARPRDQGYSELVGLAAIKWAHQHLYFPEDPDLPWRYTPEQLRFILWWYATDPAKGHRFVWRRGIFQRVKGAGKGPLGAALGLTELLGPCRPKWDPRRREWTAARADAAWVQLAATSYDQTANTFDMARGMIGDRSEIDGMPVDCGQTRILAGPTKARKLLPVTSEAKTLEGSRPSFVLADETHLWTSSDGGHRLAAVCRRNLGKSKHGMARMLVTTNAHMPGMDSVAERDYETYQAQQEHRARTTGILFDSIESSYPVLDLGDEAELRAALADCRGDATWLDVDRIVQEIYDLTVSPDEARRFYLNQIVAHSDSWVEPKQVDAAVVDDRIQDGRIVALGFDGSKSNDATALVAVDVETGLVELLGCWEKPDMPGHQDWSVPKPEVEAAVARAFTRFRVAAFACDMAYWEPYVEIWAETYRDDVFTGMGAKGLLNFDMRSTRRLAEFTIRAEATETAFGAGTMRLSRDPALVRHLKNARRRPNAYGIGLGKESRQSTHKIDAAVAMIIALQARHVALEKGVLAKWRTRTGTLVGLNLVADYAWVGSLADTREQFEMRIETYMPVRLVAEFFTQSMLPKHNLH
ncbi:terminase [Glycomyces sp. NPDC048151]|uniref:terminase n=1 Tax=Glycomyces sp. NPDC048151 TaxID=3364002 RepID=UPI003710862C